MFKEDASDNLNKKLGILAGCADGKLFTEGTWNSEFCAEMQPKDGDTVITGKKGLDAFPNTTLEAELRRPASRCRPCGCAQLLRRVDDAAARVREGLQRRDRHRLLRA